MPEQVVDSYAQIVVGVHQPARGDDSVAIDIGVVAEGDIEIVLESDQAGHGVRRRTIHANLAVAVDRHERKGGVDPIVDHRQVEPVALGDQPPVAHRRTAHGIDAQPEAGAANGIQVEHLA